MEIDPFTFACQVLNFLLLAWLLKRFLFDRVAAVVDERARRTAAALAEAEAARRAASEAALETEARLAAIEAERRRILAEADALSELELGRAREEARSAGERELLAWSEELADRKEGFVAALGERTGEWLGDLARTALRDLADEGLEAAMLRVFLARLAAADGECLSGLRAAVAEGRAAEIVSSFDLGAAERALLAAAVVDRLGAEEGPDFRVAGGGSPGIALRAGGYSLGWGVEEYLGGIEARMRAAFEAESLGRRAGHV